MEKKKKKTKKIFCLFVSSLHFLIEKHCQAIFKRQRRLNPWQMELPDHQFILYSYIISGRYLSLTLTDRCPLLSAFYAFHGCQLLLQLRSSCQVMANAYSASQFNVMVTFKTLSSSDEQIELLVKPELPNNSNNNKTFSNYSTFLTDLYYIYLKIRKFHITAG